MVNEVTGPVESEVPVEVDSLARRSGVGHAVLAPHAVLQIDKIRLD
jgi:hypothetical protein